MNKFNRNFMSILNQEWIMNIHKIEIQSEAERRQQALQRINRKTVLNKKHNLVRH